MLMSQKHKQSTWQKIKLWWVFRPFYALPNPHRFWAPELDHNHNWWFYWMNMYFVRLKYNIRRIHISNEDLTRLKHHLEAGRANILTSNHLSFQEPNIYFWIFLYHKLHRPIWMAGVDPYEKLNGIVGWFMANCGALSIDRGRLDRPAIKLAEETPQKVQRTLFIFPEGEADYSHRMVRPFNEGLAQFALKALAKVDEYTPVTILPQAVVYAPKTGKEYDYACGLVEEYASVLTRLGVAFKKEKKSLSTGEAINQLNTLRAHLLDASVQKVFDDVKGLYSLTSLVSHSDDSSDLLKQHYRQLSCDILNAMLAEHDPKQLEGENKGVGVESDLATILMAKNRLRSILASKVQALPKKTMTSIDALMEELEKSIKTLGDEASLPDSKQALLYELEQTVTGDVPMSGKVLSLAQRLSTLKKQWQKYHDTFNTFNTAEGSTQERWQRQILDCRTAKLLFLTADDVGVSLTDFSERQALVEADDTLTRLMILMFSKFRYANPKETFVKVLEPIDVRAFVERHPEQSRREHATALTQMCYEQTQHALTAILGSSN